MSKRVFLESLQGPSARSNPLQHVKSCSWKARVKMGGVWGVLGCAPHTRSNALTEARCCPCVSWRTRLISIRRRRWSIEVLQSNDRGSPPWIPAPCANGADGDVFLQQCGEHQGSETVLVSGALSYRLICSHMAFSSSLGR